MKRLLKTGMVLLAAVLMLPLAGAFHVASRILGRDKAFPGYSQLVSLIPGLAGVYLRRAFYWWVLPECGRNACISFGTVLSHSTARIGRAVYVGVGCMIGDVTLEDDVLLGSHVSVVNGGKQHGIKRLDTPIREQPGEYVHITIGCDTWVGDRSIILADVGRHCVIGAGSVVTKPIPDYAIAFGCPARVVRFRNPVELTAVDLDQDAPKLTAATQ